jgi:hypothetical protein
MSFGKVRRTNIRVVSAVAIILARVAAQCCTGNILRSVGYHETQGPWLSRSLRHMRSDILCSSIGVRTSGPGGSKESRALVRSSWWWAATSNPAQRRVVEPSFCLSAVRTARFRPCGPGCRNIFIGSIRALRLPVPNTESLMFFAPPLQPILSWFAPVRWSAKYPTSGWCRSQGTSVMAWPAGRAASRSLSEPRRHAQPRCAPLNRSPRTSPRQSG